MAESRGVVGTQGQSARSGRGSAQSGAHGLTPVRERAPGSVGGRVAWSR
jgi:hypothetical protein